MEPEQDDARLPALSSDVDDLYGVAEENTITLSAQLADEFGNLVAEAGRTVEWFRDGSPIGTSPTDGSGVTTFDYNVGTVSSNTTVTIMASDGQASGSVSIIIVDGSGGGGGGGIIF